MNQSFIYSEILEQLFPLLSFVEECSKKMERRGRMTRFNVITNLVTLVKKKTDATFSRKKGQTKVRAGITNYGLAINKKPWTAENPLQSLNQFSKVW